MKLDYTTGCICFSLLVDNKELVDLSREDLIVLAKTIINNIIEKDQYPLESFYEIYLSENIDFKEETWEESYNKRKKIEDEFKNLTLDNKKLKILEILDDDNIRLGCPVQELYIDFCRNYGKYKNLGTCDCCGDIIENWTIEIF